MSLKDKLEKLQESKSKNQIDWEKRIMNWQEVIEKILSEIKLWLQTYIDSGLLQVVESEIVIQEEFLGEYKAKQLEFLFGNFQLVFEPIGRNILGAKGRIDFYLRGSKSDKYIMVLLEIEEGNPIWYFFPVKTKSDRIEFTKESIETLLEYWIEHYTN